MYAYACVRVSMCVRVRTEFSGPEYNYQNACVTCRDAILTPVGAYEKNSSHSSTRRIAHCHGGVTQKTWRRCEIRACACVADYRHKGEY